jgi:hypothetical protein
MSHNQHVISHDAFRCPCIKGIKAGFDATKLLPKARPVYCYCFNDGTGTVQICQGGKSMLNPRERFPV